MYIPHKSFFQKKLKKDGNFLLEIGKICTFAIKYRRFVVNGTC